MNEKDMNKPTRPTNKYIYIERLSRYLYIYIEISDLRADAAQHTCALQCTVTVRTWPALAVHMCLELPIDIGTTLKIHLLYI